MGGIASRGITISSLTNLAIAGQNPSGIAAQGQMILGTTTEPSWEYLVSVSAQANAPSTNPIDTTGANLLVAHIANGYVSVPTISDSNGNTWNLGISTVYVYVSIIYYSINPVVGPEHVFQFGGVGSYRAANVSAFKINVPVSGGQSSIGTAPATSLTVQPAAIIVPSGSLIVTGAMGNVSLVSVDSGFTIRSNVPVSGASQSSTLASLTTTSGLSVSPTWTVASNNSPLLATMIAFVPS